MSDEEINMGILVDVRQAHQDLDGVEEKVKQTQYDLLATKQQARDTWTATLSVIRNSWGLLRGILKASGVTVSAITNAVVESVLRVGQEFVTLATAQAVTPGMQIAAALTLIQAGIIIASAYALEKENADIQRQIESTNLIFNNVNHMVGTVNF